MRKRRIANTATTGTSHSERPDQTIEAQILNRKTRGKKINPQGTINRDLFGIADESGITIGVSVCIGGTTDQGQDSGFGHVINEV